MQLQPHPWRTGVVALLTALPVLPLIAVGIATAAGTFATTGRLIRWLPEASPHRALTASGQVDRFIAVVRVDDSEGGVLGHTLVNHATLPDARPCCASLHASAAGRTATGPTFQSADSGRQPLAQRSTAVRLRSGPADCSPVNRRAAA
jgi:hypothetical protein